MSSCSLFNMNSIVVDIKNDNYQVKAKYPKLQSPENQRLLKNFVLDEVTKFQNSYGTDNEGYKHKLKINYKIYDSKEFKSIVFKVKFYEDKDVENLFFKSFVINKKTENLLTISDVLNTDLKLMVTAQFLRDKLKELIPKDYYDENRVLRATNPKPSNFKNFYYDGKDLHIIFSPLVLADFEAGFFDIPVKFLSKN